MRRSILAASIALLAACANEASRPPGVSIRDSAGIRIIENAEPDSARMMWWIVDDTVALEIGEADAFEAEMLHDVQDAARVGDGSIAVATRTDVRYFDADGRHLRTAGRQGAGPGEFSALTALLRAGGDSLWAFDYRLQRVSILSPEGEHVDDIALGGTVRSGDAFGRYPDGGIATLSSVPPRRGEQPAPGVIHRFMAVYGVVMPEGGRYDTIGVFPYRDELITMRGTTPAIGPPAYGRATVVAHYGDDFFIGTQEAPEIRVYSRRRRLTRIIRTGVPMVPITRERVEQQFLPRFLQRLPPESRERAAEIMRLQFVGGPWPPFVPPYGQILTDTEGNLWVADYDPANRPVLWTVYGPDGQAMARARLPEGLEIYEIGPDYVLGRWRDELRVEYVRLHRLERS